VAVVELAACHRYHPRRHMAEITCNEIRRRKLIARTLRGRPKPETHKAKISASLHATYKRRRQAAWMRARSDFIPLHLLG
jgi:hypothetical protein